LSDKQDMLAILSTLKPKLTKITFADATLFIMLLFFPAVTQDYLLGYLFHGYLEKWKFKYFATTGGFFRGDPRR